jgi:hypothetical protein
VEPQIALFNAGKGSAHWFATGEIYKMWEELLQLSDREEVRMMRGLTSRCLLGGCWSSVWRWRLPILAQARLLHHRRQPFKEDWSGCESPSHH